MKIGLRSEQGRSMIYQYYGRSVSGEHQASRKKEKARITITACCNTNRSHKLSLWLIETLERPHCFGRNKTNISSLGVKWRHNTKAWMSTVIMTKFL